jgi:hypothetical protein
MTASLRRRVGLSVLSVLSAAILTTGLGAQSLGLTERLSALGKTWGFLKYYHNRVGEGRIDWDRPLLERIPRIKLAASKSAFNYEIQILIRAAGYATEGRNANVPAKDADFSWMDDGRLFSPVTSALLNEVYLRRTCAQNYSAPFNSETNVIEFNEVKDDAKSTLDETRRLLGLFRFWNAVRYFFPHRTVMDEDWNAVLDDSIPKFLAASTAAEYNLAVGELAARLNDGHAVPQSTELARFWGLNWSPLVVRRLENRAVVEKTYPALLGGADIRPGDVITAVNGTPFDDLRRDRSRYIQASNAAFLEFRLARYLLRSNAAGIVLTLERGGGILSVIIPGASADAIDEEEINSWPAPAYSVLPGNVGFVHMGALSAADVNAAMAALAATRGIVFDLRYFPAESVYNLCNFLYPQQTVFCHASCCDYCYPGRFKAAADASGGPGAPSSSFYRGQVVVLVNEKTLSRGEFTALALRLAPGAVVIGSPTAGAAGNVSSLPLPGAITASFTGMAVTTPDYQPVQRLGLKPDILVRPTIGGLQAGRDEELERAVAFILNGR